MKVRSTVNFQKAKEMILMILKTNSTPFLKGKPGVGKSALVKEICEQLNIQFLDIRLSQHESSDIGGIPVPDLNENISRWLTPEFLPFKHIKKFQGTKGILFLDELNRARPDVLQAVFQLVYDRKVREHELLDTWHIVCAGNLGSEDGTDVIEFDSALNDRFVFIELEENYKDWLTWAKRSSINDLVMGFIEKHPDKLYHKYGDDEEMRYITPRTWERFSRILEKSEMDEIEFTKFMGYQLIDGLVTPFIDYCEKMFTVTAKDILNKFKKIEPKLKQYTRDRINDLNKQLQTLTNGMYVENMSVDDKVTKQFENLALYFNSEYITEDFQYSFCMEACDNECPNFYFDLFLDNYPEIAKRLKLNCPDLNEKFEKIFELNTARRGFEMFNEPRTNLEKRLIENNLECPNGDEAKTRDSYEKYYLEFVKRINMVAEQYGFNRISVNEKCLTIDQYKELAKNPDYNK